MRNKPYLWGGLATIGVLVLGLYLWMRPEAMQELDKSFKQREKAAVETNQKLHAKINTNLGDFKVELYHDKAPKTVSNFVQLARDNFYDGIIFHRVIDQFMIQTGDPTGTGRGGPGYRFEDEFHPDLRHDDVGVLSMANSGPNTNGSQFFITVAETAWLDNRHSVFGKVVAGYSTIEKISAVKRDSADKPLETVKIVDVEIDGEWFEPVEFEKIRE